ncbi:MAG: hypothetical protein M1812_002401 [Candelaria pacifica]|nr:MAG: hypothetical protein M1812_002401 [Candelaria pacifica]
MIIYKDILTGDEIISDTWNLKEIDGAVYEVDCKSVTKGIENIDTGANASAEVADEALEDAPAQVIDVVDAFRLELTSKYDKKQFLTYLKGYMKRVKEAMKEKGADEATIKEFESGAQGYAKKILSNIKDFDFYTGSSQDPDGMIVLLNYREDGVTPFVTVWKHGLTEMKV